MTQIEAFDYGKAFDDMRFIFREARDNHVIFELKKYLKRFAYFHRRLNAIGKLGKLENFEFD